MRPMKRLSLLIAAAFVSVLGLVTPAKAEEGPPEPWRYSVLYDAKARETIPVVGVKLTTLPDFLGKAGLEPEIWSVAGVHLGSQRPTVGFAAVLPYRAARNLTLYAGGAALVQNSRPVGYGLVFGASLILGGLR